MSNIETAGTTTTTTNNQEEGEEYSTSKSDDDDNVAPKENKVGGAWKKRMTDEGVPYYEDTEQGRTTWTPHENDEF